ncbi:MAG: phosphoribosylformylglycinamidine synthase subunit PurS [Candidatus Kapaibacterium sp.]
MAKYQAKIKITLRKDILDVQGKTVEHALHQIGFEALSGVRMGKYVTLEVEAGNQVEAKKMVEEASEKLIANPIIEDYVVTIEE